MYLNLIKGRFSVNTVLASMFLASIVEIICTQRIVRNPSSMDDGVELTIQSLNIDPSSRLKAVKNVYLRATINDSTKFEFGKTEGWSLNLGEKKPLDIHLKLQNSWVKNDEFQFKLELVQTGTFEPVLVRCAQIAKQVNSYNRSYQCNIPGEATPLLVYRVGRKPEDTMSVAQANVPAPKSAATR